MIRELIDWPDASFIIGTLYEYKKLIWQVILQVVYKLGCFLMKQFTEMLLLYLLSHNLWEKHFLYLTYLIGDIPLEYSAASVFILVYTL